MNRKPFKHQQNFPKQSINASKSVENNENNIKKKLFSGSANLANDSYGLLHCKPRALKQIKNFLPLNQKETTQTKSDCMQRYLKSQNSITDLSEIVAIDISSAEKKELHTLQQLQSVQKSLNNESENIESFHIKKHKKETFIKENNDNSIRLDDFQILDIYQSTAIKPNQSVEHVTDLRQRRKSGGIRKNSIVVVQDKQSLMKTHGSSVNEELNKWTLTERVFEQQSSARKSSQNHTKRPSVDISQILDQDIRKCGELLFRSICKSKQSLSQSDFEKAGLVCEMRLILGPILTKFKQKKYSELNLSTFGKQFSLIMKDFQPKECLEIVNKIEENRHLEFLPEPESQIEEQKLYYAEQLILSKNMSKLQQTKQISKSQQKFETKQNQEQNDNPINRLEKLRSKVDSFLDKINTQYSTSSCNSVSKISEKHKFSILMSRLTQIEELSGDSEDLASKRDSLPNQITEMDSDSIEIVQINQITRDVYMKESQREILEEDSFQCQTKKFQDTETCINFKKQPEKSDQNSYFQHQPLSTQPTKRKYLNQFEQFSRSRQRSNGKIYEKLFPEPQSLDLTNRISFNTINLQFNELSKYLY